MDAGWYPFNGLVEHGHLGARSDAFSAAACARFRHAHAHGRQDHRLVRARARHAGIWLYEKHPEWLLGRKAKTSCLNWAIPKRALAGRACQPDRSASKASTSTARISTSSRSPSGAATTRRPAGHHRDQARRPATWPTGTNCGGVFPICRSIPALPAAGATTWRRCAAPCPLWRSDYAYEPAAMQRQPTAWPCGFRISARAFNSLDPYIFRSQMAPAIGIGLEAGRYDHGYERMAGLMPSGAGPRTIIMATTIR